MHGPAPAFNLSCTCQSGSSYARGCSASRPLKGECSSLLSSSATRAGPQASVQTGLETAWRVAQCQTSVPHSMDDTARVELGAFLCASVDRAGWHGKSCRPCPVFCPVSGRHCSRYEALMLRRPVDFAAASDANRTSINRLTQFDAVRHCPEAFVLRKQCC